MVFGEPILLRTCTKGIYACDLCAQGAVSRSHGEADGRHAGARPPGDAGRSQVSSGSLSPLSSLPRHLRQSSATVLAVTTLVLLAACGGSGAPSPLDRLHPCTSDEGPVDAYCGTLTVFEDRNAQRGRQIALNIVLLPSLSQGERREPLFFLAGGPGQGATPLARQVREIFRQVLKERDVVLVDQRGTGKSNPLDCESDSNSLRDVTEGDAAALARLRKCLAGYDADVRLYTTPIAMDDLDDVRAHLGYERINLYGGSYGTRAALVYARQHGDRLRSMILDGVAPTDMRLPLFAARDAQRALDKLLADCETDASCRAAQPDLANRVRALLDRLAQRPPVVRITHPRTGIAEDVTVEARLVASVLFGALYNPLTASLVPALVGRAEQDDFQGLFALALANDTGDENMSLGMQLSVVCSEDAARVTADELSRAGEGTVFGGYLLRGQVKACGMWPKGTVDASYYEPVVSDVPALILSGDVDPVTPPGWGDAVATHLRRSRHVIVPATGHGVIATACGQRLVAEFVASADASGLDVTCARQARRPPFFLTPSGPDPAPPPGTATP
jgi:pimeloyl-ACP methyl ester carboxylesterase